MSSSPTTTRPFKVKEKRREKEEVEEGKGKGKGNGMGEGGKRGKEKENERLEKENEKLKKENEKLEKEKEKLLAVAAKPDSPYIARPDTRLKEGRYKIIRKLEQGHYSNTFLVEDLQFSQPSLKYLGVKILSVDATQVNGTHELEILLKVSEQEVGYLEPPLPVLLDHFTEEGLHGHHYCFLGRPLSMDVNAFRASAPTGRLDVHFVKPIVADTVEALQRLHSRNIIHTDIKASNLLFFDLGPAQIEEIIARDPPSYNDVYTFNGTEYLTLETQPLQPVLSWDATPFYAETIQVVLSGLGTALWADRPNPPGDIGTLALRAPENVIRAQCGKEIDIWAIGCMTYELLTGQTLFRLLGIPSLTPNENLLLLQFAVTGETLFKDIIDQSRVRGEFFDREDFLIHLKENIYPPQSIKERLTELRKDLTEVQINAAARFINDCLRLNPQDRPAVDQLAIHPWLSTAFMGAMD